MTAIERLLTFIEADLPEADILTWMEKLTDEQRQEIQGHVLRMAEMAETVLCWFVAEDNPNDSP